MTALGGLLFALGFVLVVVAWYGRITVPAKFATVALGAPSVPRWRSSERRSWAGKGRSRRDSLDAEATVSDMTHQEATGCDCEQRMAARLDEPVAGDEASHFVTLEQFMADVADGRFQRRTGQ